MAAAYRYVVSRQGDDAFYEVFVGIVNALEHDDVPAPGLREAVDELVHEHPVAYLERWDHAARGDPERLHDERPDEAEHQGEGNQQYDQVLERASTLLAGGPALLARGPELLLLVVRPLGHEALG